MNSTLKNFTFLLIIFFGLINNFNENRCDASVPVHHKSTENEFTSSESTQEKFDKDEKIPKDQTLVVRLPSNTLLKYTSYKDVSILHFNVPEDTHTAIFTFKAFEESKSAFQRKCKPRDVSLHLKASSYPVISPENITFPKNFLNAELRFHTYSLQFKSNEKQERITVVGPQIGNWFAVAFVSWTDPNNERIEQQGLAASCDTLLLAEMSVSRFQPVIINNGQVHYGSLTSNSKIENITKTSKWYSIQNVGAAVSFATTATTANNNNNNSKHKNNNKKSSNPFASQSSDASGTASVSQTPWPSTSTAATATATEIQQKFGNTTTKSNVGITSAPSASALPFTATTTAGGAAATKKASIDNTNSTTNNEIIYKFFVPRNIGAAIARITVEQVCSHCPDVGFHIQANAYPHAQTHTQKQTQTQTTTTTKPEAMYNGFENNYMHTAIIKPNQTGQVSIEFFVQPNSWHYALFKFAKLTDLAHLKFFENLQRPDRDVSLLLHQRLARQLPRPRMLLLQPQNNETIWYNFTYSLEIEYVGEHKNEHISKYDDDDDDVSKTITNETMPSAAKKSKENNPWQPELFRGIEFYPLLRQSYREFFMFDYDLLPDVNGTVPTLLNLTAGTPAGFTFDIGDVYDIGGTLTFAVSMKHGFKASSELKAKPTIAPPNERSGILAEKLIGDPPTAKDAVDDNEKTKKGVGSNVKSTSRSNQTIIVCMHLNEPLEPTWPDKCRHNRKGRYGSKLLPASAIVNNTDGNTSTGLVHVPFPEKGQWYITMGLYCHGAETAARATIIDSVKEFVKNYAYMLDSVQLPCACAEEANQYLSCLNDTKCIAAMSETETLKIKECLMDSKCTVDYMEMTQRFERHHKFATEQHFALDNCNTSVVFTVSSSPCVAGRCGRFGRCFHYMSGGFVFSTCVCMKGYRGWDCTEDTQVPSSISILMASLLLTLSNLLFFPSIYIASRRKYYTEAIIYFFAMFFSIFYHACDSGEDEYSFCLVKIGVLQFCDFYCGLLAIWVTLVAMSHIRPQFVSLLHMIGAILLAFGTELNKQSLWVFLAPALTGVCIISASWGLRCHKSRKWFPARKYLTVYMPMGIVLVMIGLVCYAFLQTKKNYHIVHSIWHMLMALSILCLLPSRKSFIPKC